MESFYYHNYSKKDNDSMELLLRSRDLPLSYMIDLPEIGVIIHTSEGIPICAGFLRRCEGNIGFIDGYISNSEMPKDLRNHTLNVLTDRLVAIAKSNNLTKLIAFSKDLNTIDRGTSHDFQIQNDLTIFIKTIKE